MNKDLDSEYHNLFSNCGITEFSIEVAMSIAKSRMKEFIDITIVKHQFLFCYRKYDIFLKFNDDAKTDRETDYNARSFIVGSQLAIKILLKEEGDTLRRKTIRYILVGFRTPF